MKHPAVLRLGTRASLLAVAQSRQLAAELNSSRPDIRCELIPVSTRGDRDLDTPLTQIDDAGFFSTDLDHALLSGDIDFCVHSLKDLPREPAPGITRVALPQRADPRDVVLFRQDILHRLSSGAMLRIGSSSARRQVNTMRFLATGLPHRDRTPQIECLPLRGPVDQRLRAINVAANDPDALDGIILALAGLSRLWNDADGRRAIGPLLKEARWMVLPLTECPAAPGQGVLAIECRTSDAATRDSLHILHDKATASAVAAEHAAVDSLPNPVQDAAGATSLMIDPLGPVTFIARPDAEPATSWSRPPRPAHPVAWDGSKLAATRRDEPIAAPLASNSTPALFVAHWRAFTAATPIDNATRVWVSGTRSWRELARHGVWVEGCADNLGFRNITDTLATAVLELPPLADWTALTAEHAAPTWHGSGIGNVVASYRHAAAPTSIVSQELRREISRSTHFYWGSTQQFKAATEWLPQDAQHSCGLGKTAESLHRLGVNNLTLFPSRKAWQQWLA